MSLDYQKISDQVRQMGATAPERVRRLGELRESALQLLNSTAGEAEHLKQKVETTARLYDHNLRCARPAMGPNGKYERLDQGFPLPALPQQATILAADGSQINPDRHSPVGFGLINIGSIQISLGTAEAPQVSILSQLIFDDELYTIDGTLTEARLALRRDLRERKRLRELAENAIPPVITFTDGPMELWGAKDAENSQEYQTSLQEYLAELRQLEGLQVATAGYVDKPAANLVVRLLEIASLPEDQLAKIRETFPLRGVLDRYLFWDILEPGQRSAVFAIQSSSAQKYTGELELHFFYLNVGRERKPWLSRVEIPAWIVRHAGMLDAVHAVLVQQCQILGNRPYPYLLHRAHETALVTWEDRQQVENMIEIELRRQGVGEGEISHKQALKNLAR